LALGFHGGRTLKLSFGIWPLKSNLGWLVLSDEERGQIPLCHEMKTIGANRTRSLGRTVTTLQRNI
jgi:hypothetical protein